MTELPINLNTNGLRALRLRSVATGTLIVMLIVLAFAMLWVIRNVLAAIFLGLLLATALRPVVSRLRSGNIPRFLAASAAVLLLVVVTLGFVILLVPIIIEQLTTLSSDLPRLYGEVREQLLQAPYRLVRQFGMQLRASLPPPDERGMINSILDQAMVWLPTIGYLAFGALNTLLFTYYWLLYRERSLRGMLLLLPMERRDGIEAIWNQIEERIGAFLRGQVLLALATGGLSLIGYWAVGAPYVLLLALISGLLELIPFVGPFISGLIAVAAGFSVSPTVGLGALVVAILIQQAENIFLAPRIMDKTVGVTPVVTLLAFVAFAALLGPVGGLLAIPLAATLQVLFSSWMARRATQTIEETVQGRTMIDRLRYQARDLAQDLAGHMRQKDDEVTSSTDQAEESLEQVLAEFEGLLEQTEKAKQA